MNGGAARVRRLASVVAGVAGRRVPQRERRSRLEAALGLAHADGDAVAGPGPAPSSTVGAVVVDHLGVVVPEDEPKQVGRA